MAEFKRIEFTCSGTDDTGDVHSDVSAAVGVMDLVSFLGKTPSRTRIPLDPALVEALNVNAMILQKLSDQFDKGLSLFLVLPVRPGARRFQLKSFVVKPPHDRAVADLHLTMLGQIAVKLPSGPMSLVDFFRVENNLLILFAPLLINL